MFQDIGNRSIADAASALAQTAKATFEKPGLILCSTGVNTKGEYFDGISFVSTIEKELGEDNLFYGGMAGDDFTFSGAYIFTDDKETDHGIAALLLDENRCACGAWPSVKPMGISRTITKSIGNLVYTIDDKPAVEMYFKYLGKAGKAEDKDFDVLNELSFHYPFIADRGDGETIIKSPMKIDHAENALVMDLEMTEGTKFWFCTPPDFEISEPIIQEAAQLKNAADALLIFSCAGNRKKSYQIRGLLDIHYR